MRLSVLLLLSLFLVGCEAPTAMKPTETKPVDTTTHTPPAKDNTAVNERDRHVVMKTPVDQANNQADINISAEIRKQIVAHDDFSVNAHNVKVITADGQVTLRGPVASDAERQEIEKIAKSVAGNDKVDNQLDVAP